MNTRLVYILARTMNEIKDGNEDSATEKVVNLLASTIHDLTTPILNVLARCRTIYEDDGKIPAIKEYRSHTGCGLKDAKDKIEGAADAEKWVEPFKFSFGVMCRFVNSDTYYTVLNRRRTSVYKQYQINDGTSDWHDEYKLKY